MAFTYVAEQTASFSSQLDFTNLDNSYSCYRFVISNVVLSNSTSFQVKTSTDNLSTFSTNGATIIQYGTTNNSIAPIKVAVRNDAISLCATDAAARSVMGYLDMAEVGQANNQMQANFDVSMNGFSTGVKSYTGFIYDEQREKINSVRFKPVSGTITSGTITLYGVS